VDTWRAVILAASLNPFSSILACRRLRPRRAWGIYDVQRADGTGTLGISLALHLGLFLMLAFHRGPAAHATFRTFPLANLTPFLQRRFLLGSRKTRHVTSRHGTARHDTTWRKVHAKIRSTYDF